jgi:hypothetical protein
MIHSAKAATKLRLHTTLSKMPTIYEPLVCECETCNDTGYTEDLSYCTCDKGDFIESRDELFAQMQAGDLDVGQDNYDDAEESDVEKDDFSTGIELEVLMRSYMDDILECMDEVLREPADKEPDSTEAHKNGDESPSHDGATIYSEDSETEYQDEQSPSWDQLLYVGGFSLQGSGYDAEC